MVMGNMASSGHWGTCAIPPWFFAAQDLDSGEAGGMDSHQAQPMAPTKFVWNIDV